MCWLVGLASIYGGPVCLLTGWSGVNIRWTSLSVDWLVWCQYTVGRCVCWLVGLASIYGEWFVCWLVGLASIYGEWFVCWLVGPTSIYGGPVCLLVGWSGVNIR